MSRQRATFGKLQRERDKQAKAKAKRDRRQAGPEDGVAAVAQDTHVESHESADTLLELIADVQRRFDNEEIGFEEYDERKSELLRRLRID